MPVAILCGSFLSRSIELICDTDASQDWAKHGVRTVPAEGGRLRVEEFARPQDAENELRGAGFTIIDESGEQTSLAGELVPILTGSVHAGRAALYPRALGRDGLSRMTGGATWDETERCWLMDTAGYDNAVAAGVPVSALWPPPAQTAPEPEPALAPLPGDGTILGLRGVSLEQIVSLNATQVAGLTAMGFTSAFDVLHTKPRAYIDASNPMPITSSPVGSKVSIVAQVRSINKPPPGSNRPLMVNVEDIADGTKIGLKFFRAPWLARTLSPGAHVLASGTSEQYQGRWQINSPLLDVISPDVRAEAGKAVISMYAASGKNDISTWDVRRVAKAAALRLGDLHDPLPRWITAKRALVERSRALRDLHVPLNLADAENARRRLAYEELFRLQVTVAMARHAERAHPGVVMDTPGRIRKKMIAAKPYPLTDAQQRVSDEIITDMAQPVPMNRLLMGEVGSGKTAVIASALAQAAESGYQAVLMAPLDDLAAQHYHEMRAELPDTVRVELIAKGGVTGAKRKRLNEDIAAGHVDIIVGTSALISPKMQYANLGLVVIDEQHRFGVEQRAALSDKAREHGVSPDVLVVTATPAPRTAQLTVFGDLDVSIIDQMPPGRSPVDTKRADALPVEAIAEHVRAGHQVFIVTPTIATSKARGLLGVDDLVATIAGSLPDVKVAGAHGKMKLAERNATLADFRAGRLDVLVSTTIIEVGVNVPNATLLVVTGAESLGITQLHQLRGRVGRGQWPGECVVLTSKPADRLSAETNARIEAFVATTNGFELAQVDLELRGAGSMAGLRQEGQASDLRIADLIGDLPMNEAAREDARELIASDPRLGAYPLLRAEIEGFIGKEGMTWLETL